MNNRHYFMAFLLLWAVQMAAALWFCVQKQGFHEDEYYTYYSTSRTNGFYVEDGTWMDRDTYRNEFVVLPGERFQYGLVRQVQSWDVHPPMYYWVFHTAASLVPGVFSKWIGLSVNLFFHGINLILLAYLSYLTAGGDRKLSLLVTFVYGFSPAAMSGVVFIRMYEMLTAFVLLCAVLHVRVMERAERNPEAVQIPTAERRSAGRIPNFRCGTRELLPMAAVTYVGFLTHYYYFIFLFFLAAAFCVWLLWRDRKPWNCLRYGLCQAAAFGLAYLTYPVFPAQMFRGQRGAQAAESFFDLSNTFERLRFFWGLMNRYVFGGLLGVMVFVLAAEIVVCLWGVWRNRDVTSHSAGERGGAPGRGAGKKEGVPYREPGKAEGFHVSYYVLLFAAAGYFAAVSKTALLLGETSVRYQLPIYGIVVLLVFLAVRTFWRRAASTVLDGRPQTQRTVERLAVAFCVVVIGAGYWRCDVAFLYPEDREQVALAGDRAWEQAPAVYFYRPGEEWCIWDVTDELLVYPEVYFASAEGTDRIPDEKIERAEALVVYLAKGADAEARLAGLAGEDGRPFREVQRVFEEKYCDVYYLWR